LLHRLSLCQCHQLLAFDDIRELSVDHSPSPFAKGLGAWFALLQNVVFTT
jgi:hypothetical protein